MLFQIKRNKKLKHKKSLLIGIIFLTHKWLTLKKKLMNINLFNLFNIKISKQNLPFKIPKTSKKERFKDHEVYFLGSKFYFHDSASFNLGLHEIYRNQCYKFESKRNNPTIIDCGANIGMSVIYFKQLYPLSQIHVFEADPKIFKFLEKNVASFKFNDIKLYNNAVWKDETLLEFYSEYGAGGRLDSSIVNSGLVREKYNVKGFQLSKLIQRLGYVDFLKIDIEGAELEVLKEIEQELDKVENLFVEYHSFIEHNQELDKLLKILTDNNFKYFIKNTLENKFPFLQKVNNVGMDLQLEIYAQKSKTKFA